MNIPTIKHTTGLRRAATRLILCMVLLIAMSGFLGQRIISSALLYKFHFFIYGNMGKIIIFATIALVIIAREKITHMRIPAYLTKDSLFLIPALISAAAFFPLSELLLRESSFQSNIMLSITTHLVGLSAVAFSMLAALGLPFTRTLIRVLKHEIGICLGISTIYYFAIFQVWKLWPFFSNIVLHATYRMFSLTFDPVIIIPPRGLYVQSFAVTIEQACSGVDSIFLFSSLYLLIAFMDWKVLNKKKMLIMVIPALLGLFAVNILRVYLLILAGVLINPQITIQLFHTYLGMVLFLIYFIVFWRLFYKWMRT